MKKAIVAGHICIDITPLFPHDKKAEELGDVLQPGHLINMNGVNVHTGGAVANTGLAMRKLGCDVRLMGKIGDDEFGKMILNVLDEYGYDGRSDMIIAAGERTSYSVVLAVPGVDRIFLHDPGANNTFCLADLDMEAVSEADLFHFGYPPLMKRIYENNGTELVAIMKAVKATGAATSLDLAAVDPDSEAGRQDWRAILANVLPYVDFFVPSVEELCYMLDRERYDEWVERANGKDITMVLDPERDIKPLADDLIEMGARVVLIKSGAPGMYYRTASADRLAEVGAGAGLDASAWADLDGFERSYLPSGVLSGTGAGDTSIAAFLTAMLEGRTPENCLQLSAATGTSCVESYDALGGLKSFDELEAKINAGWQKQVF